MVFVFILFFAVLVFGIIDLVLLLALVIYFYKRIGE